MTSTDHLPEILPYAEDIKGIDTYENKLNSCSNASGSSVIFQDFASSELVAANAEHSKSSLDEDEDDTPSDTRSARFRQQQRNLECINKNIDSPKIGEEEIEDKYSSEDEDDDTPTDRRSARFRQYHSQHVSECEDRQSDASNECKIDELTNTNETVLKSNKTKNVEKAALTARTLWVSGFENNSKLSDLKNLFCKHGKVTDAKMVKSIKGTQRKWYVLLTMDNSKDASTCIQNLDHSELGGHVISVKRRKTLPRVIKFDASVVKKQVVKTVKIDYMAGKSDTESKKGENEKYKEDWEDVDYKPYDYQKEINMMKKAKAEMYKHLPSHPKLSPREESREVTDGSPVVQQVYNQEEFRGLRACPSSSPLLKHFVPRNKQSDE